jgi:DNA-binding Lrp family transcriptional regulator
MGKEELEISESIKSIIRKLREKGYNARCVVAYNPYKFSYVVKKFVVSDGEMEYEFGYESDIMSLIPKVLKNWLKDFVGINIDG